MDIYDLTVPQLKLTLGNVDRWLRRAITHAEDKQLAEIELIQARLAPDQFPFARQVQTACDNAKFIAGRLAGKEWPPHPDTETTLEHLRTRVAAVTDYLGQFQPADFALAHERRIVLPWMQPGQWMRGDEYMVQFALPNFYFHVVTAYSILRHAGVPLGKIDYLGPIAIRAER